MTFDYNDTDVSTYLFTLSFSVASRAVTRMSPVSLRFKIIQFLFPLQLIHHLVIEKDVCIVFRSDFPKCPHFVKLILGSNVTR